MASTKNLGDRVEIKILDNGTGMMLEVKKKMLTRSLQLNREAKAPVLAFSIGHDIIVEPNKFSLLWVMCGCHAV